MIELSGGPHGGEKIDVDVEHLDESGEFEVERDDGVFLYRYVSDETRTPHAVFCGKVNHAVQK